MSCIEHLRIAEAVADLDTKVNFEWGSTDITPSSEPALHAFALMLCQHRSLSVKVRFLA